MSGAFGIFFLNVPARQNRRNPPSVDMRNEPPREQSNRNSVEEEEA
jgi:hypothetical protein